jgi:hypothetical protein
MVANVVGNDIDAGAAPTLYCITEPIPPGSYVGIDGRFGFQGGPDAEWPDIERMRLRGCRQAVRVRRKRNQDNTSRLTAMT